MWFLAFKHMFARPKQSLMTLLGIVFGSAAFVTISGFMLGFRGFLLEQLVNNDAHIKISAKEDFLNPAEFNKNFFSNFEHVFWVVPPSGRRDLDHISNLQGWVRRLKSDHRIVAFSPQLSSQAIISLASAKATAQIIGSDPQKQAQISNVSANMLKGSFFDIGKGGNRIILGSGLAQKLGAQVGQTVQVNMGNSAPIPFKVVGLFRIGIKNIDDARAYGFLPDVQKLSQRPNEVNEIGLRVRDFNQAASIATDLKSISEEQVQSWDQINENFLSVFRIQDATRYMMIAVILIVAGFGIYNILNMTVNQKKKEIAILRSIGFESDDIVKLFLTQGIVFGATGGVVGLVIGFFICNYLETIPFGGGAMGGSGYLMISFEPSIYFFGFSLGFAASSIASYLPAKSASRLLPIEIIRGGAE